MKEIALANRSVYYYDEEERTLKKRGLRSSIMENTDIIQLKVGSNFFFKICDESGKVVAIYSSPSPVKKIKDL
jgi:hypothetical protein